MAKERALAESAVKRTARALRHAAMSAEEGAFLGSEEVLMSKLAVSRATLRQAAGLVAQENLLAVRRGVGGGYFARTPDTSTVTRIAAIYLQSRQAGLDELTGAVAPIRVELARLATQNRQSPNAALLKAFLEEERAHEEAMSHWDFLRSERAFGRILGQISGNQVLTLFLDIVYDLAGLLRRDTDVYRDHPERIAAYRVERKRMAEAILEGDEEIAALASRRCSSFVTEWLDEDLAGRNFAAHLGEARAHVPPPAEAAVHAMGGGASEKPRRRAAARKGAL